MKDKVFQMVSRIMEVPVEQLNDESSPDNVLTWDSLHHMNLVLSLEEEFDTSFSDQEIIEMLNIEKIVETLKNHLDGSL